MVRPFANFSMTFNDQASSGLAMATVTVPASARTGKHFPSDNAEAGNCFTSAQSTRSGLNRSDGMPDCPEQNSVKFFQALHFFIRKHLAGF